MKRGLSILLSLLLLLLPVCSAGPEQEPPIWSRETPLQESLTLTECVWNNGYRQVERYLSYTPGGQVTPLVSYGEALCKTQRLSAAEMLEEQNARRVLAGINGDYYGMVNGMPLGLVLRDGELIASDSGNWAFGFLADGSAFLGQPQLTMSLTVGEDTYPLASVNKTLSWDSFSLFTPVYGSSTGSVAPSKNAYLLADEGEMLSIGGSIQFTVESVTDAAADVPIRAGRYLLSLRSTCEARLQAGMDSLQPGDRVTLQITAADERWNACTQGIGTLFPLLRGGEIVPGLDGEDNSLAPRTVIGLKPDGTVILYTADGRQSGYARGLTLRQAARRLLELGCTEGGALDGGGSASLHAQLPGGEAAALQSRPSDGAERRVPVFLLLTAAGQGSAGIHTISIRSEHAVLLCGAPAALTIGACDETGGPVPVPAAEWWASAGKVDNGVFTAPAQSGLVTIRAIAQGVQGSLSLPVVDTPDEITVCREDTGAALQTLLALPGSELELTAEASWNGFPVAAADEQYRWSLAGNAGSISGSGHFTASQTGGTGTLTVTAGGCSRELSVLVLDTVLCEEGFEEVTPGSAAGLRWEQETWRDRVKVGSGSLRLSYSLEAGSAAYPMDSYRTGLTRYTGFWVWNDGSGNSLYAVHREQSLLLGRMERVGWVRYVVDTGSFGPIQSLRLEGSGSGTIWLDQLLLSDSPEADLDAPVLQMSVAEDGALTARIYDRLQGTLPEVSVSLTVDGAEWPFVYRSSDGMLTAQVGTTERMQSIRLQAVDNSGNYDSVSCLLGQSAARLPDLQGHWAESYASYLLDAGILKGKALADGSLRFDPDAPMSKAEFVVMLCRWLQIDTDLYAGRGTFRDGDAIPAWAADSVAAAQVLGLLSSSAGEAGGDFQPLAPILRHEAAVILGRTMEGGRMSGDLPFSDSGEIPAEALPYVSQLARMGVMRGYANVFDPYGSLSRGQAAKLLTLLT